MAFEKSWVWSTIVRREATDLLLGARPLGATDYWKMALTVCVPYAVSTLSSVAAIRDREREEEAA